MTSDPSHQRSFVIGPDPMATERLGADIGARLEPGQGLALVGELGAGKTTLARGVARGLGVDDPDAVASPTYLVAVEHPGPRPMLHVDAYLAEKTRGFLEDGGFDYFDEMSGGVVVVEWADRVADLLPDETLWIRLSPRPGGAPGRLGTLTGGPKFVWILNLQIDDEP